MEETDARPNLENPQAVPIDPIELAAEHGTGETVTPNFEHAIPNIPGKSLVTRVVDYAPGGVSPSHKHAKSAFIYANVVSASSGSIVPVTVGSKGRAPFTV
jgi:hypothetical protein